MEAVGRRAWIAPCLAVVVFGAVVAALGYGIVDDAFISLRYARNLALGHGLVFNPGELVEGYSNPSWTLLLAAGLAAGLAGEGLAVGLGLAAGALTLVTTSLLGRQLAAPDSRALRSAGAPLALAFSAPFAAWCASGLETGLFALLLVGCLLLFQRGMASPRALRGSAAVLGAAALTRSETNLLFAFELVTLAVLAWRGKSAVRWRDVAGYALVYGVIVGAFLLWRRSTYGDWVPNTYHAKVGALGLELARGGLAYVGSFGTRSLLVVMLPAFALLPGPASPARRHQAGFCAVYLLAVVLEGGDHLPLFRFCVPILPLLAVQAQEVWAWIARRLDWRRPDLAVLLLTVATGAASSLLLATAVGGHGRTEHQRALEEFDLTRAWAGFGRWLAREAPPDASIALLPIGAIGYYSGLRVVDMGGLTDRHIARLPLTTGYGYSGHEKWDNRYVLDRRPTYVMANHGVLFKRPLTQEEYHWLAWFPVHRELVALPELQAAYRLRAVPANSLGFYVFYERR